MLLDFFLWCLADLYSCSGLYCCKFYILCILVPRQVGKEHSIYMYLTLQSNHRENLIILDLLHRTTNVADIKLIVSVAVAYGLYKAESVNTSGISE